MLPPKHHKEIANFLREKIEDDPKVFIFRDDNDLRPIAIGEFGPLKNASIQQWVHLMLQKTSQKGTLSFQQ